MWNSLHFFWSKFAVNQSGISNVNAVLLLLPFSAQLNKSLKIIIENKLSALRSGIKKHLDIVKCIILFALTASCHKF